MDSFAEMFNTLTDEQKDYLAIGIILGGSECARHILAAYNDLDDPKEVLTEMAHSMLDDARDLMKKLENAK